MFKRVCIPFILFLVVTVVCSSGCQTFQTKPNGWESASSITVEDLSSIILDIVLRPNDKDPENLRKVIIESGIAGSVDFWDNRNENMTVNNRVLSAIKVADKFSKDNYRELYDKYEGLDGILLKAILNHVGKGDDSLISVEINEAEILIALLNSFVDSGSIGNLIDLQEIEINK